MNSYLTIIIGISSLFILFILCRIFIRPIKWILGLGANCVLGSLIMLISNSILGTSFALNPVTSMISGVLGAPGIFLIFILNKII